MYHKLIRKNQKNNFAHYTPEQCEKAGVEYLVFPQLEETGLVKHLFSTRLGGVSKGACATMNFSYIRDDDAAAVDENFNRIAAVMNTSVDQFVCSDQTHTTNIRIVDRKDCGKGIRRPRDYQDVDGLITNVPGIMLATFYADCVPLYFVDTINKAIGLSHSGWRGTVNQMAACTLDAMKDAFGTKPQNVLAAIGPSICQDCYEVGAEVAEAFRQVFPANENAVIRYSDTPGKYQLDLWKANYLILLHAGVQAEHISVTDICTCCNPDYLFSHRASEGKRGNLGAFLMLN